MATADIVILVFLGVCVFIGAKNGVFRQLGGIAGLFLGIYLSYRFSSAVSGYLSGWIKASDTVINVLSFVSITLASLLVMSLLGRLLEHVFTAAAIGWVNRLMGVMLSLAIGVLLTGVVLYIFRYMDDTWFHTPEGAGLSDSKLARPILSLVDKVFPYLKEVF